MHPRQSSSRTCDFGSRSYASGYQVTYVAKLTLDALDPLADRAGKPMFSRPDWRPSGKRSKKTMRFSSSGLFSIAELKLLLDVEFYRDENAYQFAFSSSRYSYRYSTIGVKYGTLRIYELHDYVITRILRFTRNKCSALVLPVRRADVSWPALTRSSEAGQPGHLARTLSPSTPAALVDPVDCRATGDR